MNEDISVVDLLDDTIESQKNNKETLDEACPASDQNRSMIFEEENSKKKNTEQKEENVQNGEDVREKQISELDVTGNKKENKENFECQKCRLICESEDGLSTHIERQHAVKIKCD